MSPVPATEEPRRALGALRAHTESVLGLVTDLTAAQWRLETPAPGWTVADQIAHLTFVFSLAGTAAGAPDAFRELAAQVAGPGEFDAAVNAALEPYRSLEPAELLSRFRAERDAALEALARIPADGTVPWFVNPLPPVVLACAGMMECLAHGQDIADALGVSRTHDDSVAYLATFVAHTRDFGFVAHGEDAPTEPFRFELTLPSGRSWASGPEDAGQRVVGDAVDVCLLAARRRHVADLAVSAEGDAARRWLAVAQAYRGPAGAGRTPGRRTVIVRYQVRAEAAAANREAVEKVLAELAERRPEGLRYSVHALADGVTFEHVATVVGAGDPFAGCASFDEFQRGLADRMVGAPEFSPAEGIGHYVGSGESL